jgi:hypothetical protein
VQCARAEAHTVKFQEGFSGAREGNDIPKANLTVTLARFEVDSAGARIACEFRLLFTASVFHSQGFRIYCLLARDTLQSGKHTSVIVFVSLKGEAALFATVILGKTDEVFF